MIYIQISVKGIETIFGEVEPCDFPDGLSGWFKLADDLSCTIRFMHLGWEKVEFEFVEDNGSVVNSVRITDPTGLVHELFLRAIRAAEHHDLFCWESEPERELIESLLKAIVMPREAASN